MKGTVVGIFDRSAGRGKVKIGMREMTIYGLPDLVRINDEVGCEERVSSSNNTYAVFQDEPAEMEVIELTDYQERLLKDAQQYSAFRNKVKQYLQRKEMCYDKFTVTEEDSAIGYISEKCVSGYLVEKFGNEEVRVSTWQDRFDMDRVRSIVDRDSNDEDDKEYVKSYFYDRYDLRITKGDREIPVDVKSAATGREPMKYWGYLYPVVQAEKEGKECVILAYCIKNERNLIERVAICGYMSEDQIKEYGVTQQGENTSRGTQSQIDNYTTVVKDYKRLDDLIRRVLV